MKPICESVVKKDHADKVSGRSRYVADYPKEGMLLICRNFQMVILL